MKTTFLLLIFLTSFTGVFVVTSAETELTELASKLRENLFQVLGAVTHLENQMKETRENQRKGDY